MSCFNDVEQSLSGYQLAFKRMPATDSPSSAVCCSKKDGPSKEDKDKLKVAAAGVAVVAALAFGGYKVYRVRFSPYPLPGSLPLSHT